jgi:hypothetical protein
MLTHEKRVKSREQLDKETFVLKVLKHAFDGHELIYGAEHHGATFYFTSMNNGQPLQGPNGMKFRATVDIVIFTKHGIIFLEVDQMQHKFGYTIADDSARMNMIEETLRFSGFDKNIAWIRYNPDAFKIDGDTCRTTQKQRSKQLVSLLESVANSFQPATQDSSIYYLFYDSTSINGRLHPVILADKDYDEDCLRNVVCKTEGA